MCKSTHLFRRPTKFDIQIPYLFLNLHAVVHIEHGAFLYEFQSFGVLVGNIKKSVNKPTKVRMLYVLGIVIIREYLRRVVNQMP